MGDITSATDSDLKAECARLAEENAELRDRLDELTQRQNRFGELVENLVEVFWVASADLSQVFYVSPAYEHIWGRTCQSLLDDPMSWIESIHPEDAHRVRVQVKARAADPNSVNTQYTYRIVRPDGETRWILGRTFVLHEQSGEVTRLAGVAQDITQQKRFEAAYREGELRQRTLIDYAPEAVVLLDCNTARFVDANANALRLFDLKREELTALGPFELSPERQPGGRLSKDLAREKMDAALAGEVPVFEWLHCDIHGTEFPTEVRLVQFPWTGRTLVRGSITDISQRKQTQAEERRLRDWFTTLSKASPSIVFRTAPDGNCIYVNQRWHQVTGRPPNSAFGEGWSEAVHEEDREATVAGWYSTVAARQNWSAEFRFVHADGHTVWIAGRASPFITDTGEVDGYVGTCTDITDLKRVQLQLEKLTAELESRVEERTRELVRSEDRWRSLVSTAPDLIIVAWPDGRIRYINRTYVDIPIEEVHNSTIYDYVSAENQAVMRKAIEEVNETGEVREYEVEGPGPEGAPIWYSTRVGPYMENDKRVGVTMISTDVTDKKRALAELHKKEQMLRQTLALRDRERRLVAQDIHDGFVQDVVGAQMTLGGALAQLEKSPPECIDLIRRAYGHLDRALDEARNTMAELHPLTMSDEGVISAVYCLTSDPRFCGDLQVGFQSNVEFERLDPVLEGTIFRIVQEALSNVRRHSQCNEATVSIKQASDRIHIVIEDDGCGFDRQQVPRNRYGVRGIEERAHLFGGSAKIESRPGQGTTIRVDLPTDLSGINPFPSD